MKYRFLWPIAILFGVAPSPTLAQRIELLTEAPTTNIVASYLQYDTGGNTSVAFDTENAFKWSGKSPFQSGGFGYYTPTGKEIPYIKRDRDLGQTFKIKSAQTVHLQAITLKLGFGSNIVRQKTYGKAISLQLFEVKGFPKINDNGSPASTEAFHGYPHDRTGQDIASNRDDFITGETYKTIATIRGYTFPRLADFGTNEIALSPDDERLKGRLIRFAIPEKNSVVLSPDKTYAFMILLDNPSDNCGFTLANNYYGAYKEGHGIRRGGNGIFPPAKANPLASFEDRSNKAAMKAAHFPTNFNKRIKIKPSTNGYPDVCTYRDLYFIIEAQ